MIEEYSSLPINSIIYTDISKDGMMLGRDINGTKKLLECISIPIIASGGVSSISDLKKLKKDCSKLNGIVCGRALYDKKIKIDEAIRVLN